MSYVRFDLDNTIKITKIIKKILASGEHNEKDQEILDWAKRELEKQDLQIEESKKTETPMHPTEIEELRDAKILLERHIFGFSNEKTSEEKFKEQQAVLDELLSPVSVGDETTITRS